MELYNANEMPLSSEAQKRIAQEKFLNGEELSTMEKVIIGRDSIIKEYNGYKFKPDHCYRVVSEKMLSIYSEVGKIVGASETDEYKEYTVDGKLYNNNKGVDWYLGGACLRYGNIIIECPADKEYFRPAWDNGNTTSMDPTVKFMKSSGYKNPVPLSMITKIIRVVKEDKQDGPEIEKINNQHKRL